MAARKPGRPVWRKARRCDSGTCVEVRVTDNVVGMRDSKDPHGPVLWLTRTEWEDFVAGIEAGDFR